MWDFFFFFEREVKKKTNNSATKDKKSGKDILSKNESAFRVLYHGRHRSLPVSPMQRQVFPSIVACETESASSQRPASRPFFLDRIDGEQSVPRYILLGHSGSPTLILDTWTYILGLGEVGEGAGGHHQSRRGRDVTEVWLLGSQAAGGRLLGAEG